MATDKKNTFYMSTKKPDVNLVDVDAVNAETKVAKAQPDNDGGVVAGEYKVSLNGTKLNSAFIGSSTPETLIDLKNKKAQ